MTIVDFRTGQPVDPKDLPDADDSETFHQLYGEMKQCGEQVFDWLEEWMQAGHDGQASLWMVLRTAADIAYDLASDETAARLFIDDAVLRDDAEAQQ